jgi:hypothetical protein
MKDEDVHNLLGGFAAGILTDRERELLFTAALKDQKLFDALADEEALRELLNDPVSRSRLLQAVETAKPGAWGWLSGWMRRPAYWAIAGGGVAALTLVVALLWEKTAVSIRPAQVEIAQSAVHREETLPPTGRNEPRAAPAPMLAPKPADRERRTTPSAAPRAAVAQPAEKMKVAVLDFKSPATEAGAGKTASDMLTRNLDSSGYAVVPRKEVDEALQAKKLESPGLDASTAASVGRSVGADAVIVGAVQVAPPAAADKDGAAGKSAAGKSNASKTKAAGGLGGLRARDSQNTAAPAPGLEVTATAINSQTADNLAVASSQRGSSQDANLSDAVDQVAQSLRQQIQQKSRIGSLMKTLPKSQAKPTWTVTGVTAALLTLDGGSKTGLKVGDRLEVRRDSKPIGKLVITSVKDSLAVGEFKGDGEAKIGDTAAFPVSN